MEKKYVLLLSLVNVLFLYYVGIFLFTSGFLLKRSVIEKSSQCKDSKIQLHHDDANANVCWMEPKFSKAIIIVIDALRFDFARYKENASDITHFENKLPVFHQLLRNSPDKSRLYQFVADPPTTTMQRLKGLTTGSLPTFVDAGSNFASSEITEDNFIHHFKTAGKNITFMGDDTWQGLFPHSFATTYPFDSFNVQDLHTVDNGVIEHFLPEINKGYADLIIAHFLGVDHCGHKYGPDHRAMSEKLTQMNGVIRSAVEAMDEDTVLFVLGDHGMTRTGDHGGDSDDEVDAALFVYSHKPLTEAPSLPQNEYLTVSQIDLVPTISLLLGIPIPYSNLGQVIVDLFTYTTHGAHDSFSSLLNVVQTLHLNAQQVRNYLKSYSEVSGDLPYSRSAQLESQFIQLNATLDSVYTNLKLKQSVMLHELEDLRQGYIEYLQGAKNMCQDVWAKFDLKAMAMGIILVILAIIISIYLFIKEHFEKHHNKILKKIAIVPIAVTAFFLYNHFISLDFITTLVSATIGICAILIFMYILYSIKWDQPGVKAHKSPNKGLSLDSIFAILCTVLYAVGSSSNSYVVHEDTVLVFLIQTMSFAHFFTIVRNIQRQNTSKTKEVSNKKLRFDLGRIMTSPVTIGLVLVLLLCLCVRLSSLFGACREEQWTCEPTDFLKTISSLPDDRNQYKNLRYLLSVCSIGSIVLLSRHWLSYCGNLNGYSPVVLCMLYGVPLSAVCVGLNWALQGLPAHLLDKLPVWQIVLLPQLVYLMTGFTFIVLAMSPLCLFILERNAQEEQQPFISQADTDIVPKVYNHLKSNWRKHLVSHRDVTSDEIFQESRQRPPPLVYGLASVYSASTIVLTVCVAILLVMLLRDGVASSVALAIISMALFLELHTSTRHSATSDEMPTISWSAVATWGLLAGNYFYATGHQATVPTIQWEAAWNGFQGDFTIHAIPATLITLNTFASQVLFCVALPLVLLWPYSRRGAIFSFQSKKQDNVSIPKKGEFELNENPQLLEEQLFHLIIGYLLFHGIKLFGTMVSAAVLRRHLMVWKIFAPRYVFEGASFLLVSTLLIIMYCFVWRLDTRISQWVQTIESKQK